MARNAGVIRALELVVAARLVLAMNWLFVVAIRAVLAAVAQPLPVDARVTIVALVIGLRAHHNCAAGVFTVLQKFEKCPHIRSLDAMATRCVQTRTFSFRLWPIYQFIASIAAVRITIATPALRDACAVAAHEIAFRTFGYRAWAKNGRTHIHLCIYTIHRLHLVFALKFDRQRISGSIYDSLSSVNGTTCLGNWDPPCEGVRAVAIVRQLTSRTTGLIAIITAIIVAIATPARLHRSKCIGIKI